MRKNKTLFCLAKMILSLALAATVMLSSGTVAKAALLGIDVSRWQGAIDWTAVPSIGVSFTFIRVGTTKGGIDPYFAANVQGAQAAGLRTGVYIYSYADSVEGAINEALLVLQWIEGYSINFPVAFDIEDDVQKKLDPATITAMCNAFCDVIASAGYHPIVYTYKNFYLNRMTPELRYDLWIAQWGDHCDVPGFSIWQASSEGAIPGIAGNVDIDYMFKDYPNLIIPAGFVKRGDDTYLYNNYRIQFGWANYDNKRYYMDAAGRMVTGWFHDGTGIHYLHPADGHMLTGYQNIENANYYFGADGMMQVGMLAIGGGIFYFDPATGTQQTGFIGDLTNRYYFNAFDGQMMTGLQPIDGRIYNFGTDGRMLFGWQKAGDTSLYFNPADGAMVTGLIPGADGVYGASQIDGHQLINEIALIDNVPRCFGADGRLVVNAAYTIGNATYLCDADGTARFVMPTP